MKTVFADAGYWIAILNPADDLHVKAARLSNALNPFQIVTSEMIFTEANCLQTRSLRLYKLNPPARVLRQSA